jgi:acetoin utilization protein AcuB
MFVKSLMMGKESIITVTPKDSIRKALEIIKKENLLSVPVVYEGKFYGSVSKDKIYEFYYEECAGKECSLEDFIVEKVMKTDVPVISPMSQVEEAANFLVANRTPFIAVIDREDNFQGILTHKAIFTAFTDILGLNKGKRLSVIAYDIKGQIQKLSKIISDYGGDIISFAVIDPKIKTDVKEIVIRVRANDFDNIVEKVKEAGFRIS